LLPRRPRLGLAGACNFACAEDALCWLCLLLARLLGLRPALAPAAAACEDLHVDVSRSFAKLETGGAFAEAVLGRLDTSTMCSVGRCGRDRLEVTDTLLGVLSICSCAGSANKTTLGAETFDIFELLLWQDDGTCS